MDFGNARDRDRRFVEHPAGILDTEGGSLAMTSHDEDWTACAMSALMAIAIAALNDAIPAAATAPPGRSDSRRWIVDRAVIEGEEYIALVDLGADGDETGPAASTHFEDKLGSDADRDRHVVEAYAIVAAALNRIGWRAAAGMTNPLYVQPAPAWA